MSRSQSCSRNMSASRFDGALGHSFFLIYPLSSSSVVVLYHSHISFLANRLLRRTADLQKHMSNLLGLEEKGSAGQADEAVDNSTELEARLRNGASWFYWI